MPERRWLEPLAGVGPRGCDTQNGQPRGANRRFGSVTEPEWFRVTSPRPARRSADMSGAVAVKRFYERVGVRCAAKAEYLVTLDGRDLRTPAKKLLSVPTEGLAWAIASEWEAQPKQRIQPSLMPLMTLATTTIDQFPDIRANMTRSMLRAMESDAACLLSSDQPVCHRGLEP